MLGGIARYVSKSLGRTQSEPERTETQEEQHAEPEERQEVRARQPPNRDENDLDHWMLQAGLAPAGAKLAGEALEALNGFMGELPAEVSRKEFVQHVAFVGVETLFGETIGSDFATQAPTEADCSRVALAVWKKIAPTNRQNTFTEIMVNAARLVDASLRFQKSVSQEPSPPPARPQRQAAAEAKERIEEWCAPNGPASERGQLAERAFEEESFTTSRGKHKSKHRSKRGSTRSTSSSNSSSSESSGDDDLQCGTFLSPAVFWRPKKWAEEIQNGGTPQMLRKSLLFAAGVPEHIPEGKAGLTETLATEMADICAAWAREPAQARGIVKIALRSLFRQFLWQQTGATNDTVRAGMATFVAEKLPSNLRKAQAAATKAAKKATPRTTSSHNHKPPTTATATASKPGQLKREVWAKMSSTERAAHNAKHGRK